MRKRIHSGTEQAMTVSQKPTFHSGIILPVPPIFKCSIILPVPVSYLLTCFKCSIPPMFHYIALTVASYHFFSIAGLNFQQTYDIWGILLHLLHCSIQCVITVSVPFFLKIINFHPHPLPGEMNISQLQGKIEFNTFLF